VKSGREKSLANLKPFQPGNPGRPKGSRNRLSEDFIAAMCADFEAHGVEAIETVRTERPQDYIKVIASILPKELHVKDASLDDMSDGELIELLAAVRSITASDRPKKAGSRGKQKTNEEGSGPSRRTH
jgi:hypothetical protein